jgi:hypothetical protein
MPSVSASAVPAESLLSQRQQGGGYVDCFVVSLPFAVSHAQFVEAFYSTRVFALERLILRWIVNKPSTLEQVRALALGQIDTFAAWRVVQRRPQELLLEDFTGGTMSWLMVTSASTEQTGGDGSAPVGRPPSQTQLYFGSAVGSRSRDAQGSARMGWVFHLLLGFHKAYSRVLLRAAHQRLLVAHTSAKP